MINLSIALSYIHHALKRQVDNRHYLIMQGFAFLSLYYDTRHVSKDPCERQEAEYNIARTFHLLGLTQSAIPHYQNCLDLGETTKDDVPPGCDNTFSMEAALALQGLWANEGEYEKALQVTRSWLTF